MTAERPAKQPQPADLPILSFDSPAVWRRWLTNNHQQSPGLWLRLFKKGSGIVSVTYAEALDEALCFGWIDGQLQKHDDSSWLRKFTPRRPASIWSKRNCEHVDRLTSQGRMQPAGLREVEAAKADGRWDGAYDAPSTMEVPQDFLDELARNPKALAFYYTLNRANTYAIAWRLHTAKKPETREKRVRAIIAMLTEGKRLH